MENKNKKILFVDYYGILSRTRLWHRIDDPKHKLHKYAEPMGNFLFSEDRTLFDNWMRGLHTSEEIHQILSENFGVDFDEIFEIFKQDCKTIDLYTSVLEKLKNIPDDYIKIMVTDNMDSFDRFTLPANQVLNEIFHEINNSCRVKKLKADNNGEWFLEILKNYDVAIEDCILIDDTPKNCETFQNLGGKYYNTKTEAEVLDALDNILQS